MLTQPLIGADPELFVRYKNSFVSAHNLLPGTKDMPHFLSTNGAVQVDGTAAEFNIRPARTAAEFSEYILSTVEELTRMIKKHNPGYEVVAVPTADYKPEYFMTLPPEATMLGCEPDYNAWTKKMNKPPDPRHTFRTGGGHVHVGWLEKGEALKKEDCLMMTRQLDATLYAFSLLWDDDENRRQMYGKLGAFRYKPGYGMEYRPLSNAWVRHPDLHRFVFNTTKHAYKLGFGEGKWLIEDSVCSDFISRTHKGDLTRAELMDYISYISGVYGFNRPPYEQGG